MSDIVEFLRARLEELEAAAPSRHFIGSESQLHRCPAARDPEWCGDLEYGEENCTCGLRERRAYVLADIESKRQILAAAENAVSIVQQAGTTHVDQWIAKYLALPFADHPNYNPSWRPAEVTA